MNELTTGELHRAVLAALRTQPEVNGCFQGVRKLRNGLPFKRVVLYPSRKNGGLIPCESRLEGIFAESLEINPEIRTYRSQPIHMPGPNGSPIVPDFAIEFKDGVLALADIKSLVMLGDPDVQERLSWARTYLADRQMRYYIHTERDLHAEPQRSIRGALARAVRVDLPWEIEAQVRELVPKKKTVGELRSSLIAAGHHPLSVEKLVLAQRLAFDASRRWTPNTEIGDFYEHKHDAAVRHTIHSVIA